MKRTKIIGAIIGVTVFTLMIAGLTYAFYRSVLFNDLKVETVTPGLDYYINYTKGNDITSGTLDAGSDYMSGNSTDIELWKKDNTYDIYGHIYLDIKAIGNNLASEGALKYALVNNGTVISRGSLSGSQSGDSVLVGTNIPLSTTKQLYTVYIWLDESMNTDLNIEGELLSISVRCEATMKVI